MFSNPYGFYLGRSSIASGAGYRAYGIVDIAFVLKGLLYTVMREAHFRRIDCLWPSVPGGHTSFCGSAQWRGSPLPFCCGIPLDAPSVTKVIATAPEAPRCKLTFNM